MGKKGERWGRGEEKGYGWEGGIKAEIRWIRLWLHDLNDCKATLKKKNNNMSYLPPLCSSSLLQISTFLRGYLVGALPRPAFEATDRNAGLGPAPQAPASLD